LKLSRLSTLSLGLCAILAAACNGYTGRPELLARQGRDREQHERRAQAPVNKLAFLFLLLMAACCSSPKMPTGPSPEYEEPARPSWLEAGAPVPQDAGAD
jgi:hypothetical protein